MQNSLDTNKESNSKRQSLNVAAITLQLSSAALQWLAETTINNAGDCVCNYALFYDLLKRMRTEDGSDQSFRRPISLSSGQFQYSEENLAADWDFGRKRVRNILTKMAALGIITTEASRIASAADVVCVQAWKSPDGTDVTNPSFRAQNGAQIGSDGDLPTGCRSRSRQ